MTSPKQKEKVLLGMSGGVDSSLSAILLLEAGYEVIGCHLTMWSDDEDNRDKTAEQDARKIAEWLGIDLVTVDLRETFKNKVVDPFTDAFTKGRTPNPCIYCNKTVKFSTLIQKADELGCEFVATGHYAQIEHVGDTFALKKNQDPIKDQSYFLYRLTQEDLSRILFPLGKYTKKEVRKEAEKRNLQTKHKKESQGICFIADKDHEKFLTSRINLTPGDILNKEGERVGEHDGLALFTLGQRAPIGGPGGPWFVTEINQEKNVLVVTSNPFDPELFANTITIEDVNWTIGEAPDSTDELYVKVRHGHTPVPCTVTENEDKTCTIHLQAPIRAVMPGQSAVCYSDDIVIGGGVIQSTTPANTELISQMTQPVNDIE